MNYFDIKKKWLLAETTIAFVYITGGVHFYISDIVNVSNISFDSVEVETFSVQEKYDKPIVNGNASFEFPSVFTFNAKETINSDIKNIVDIDYINFNEFSTDLEIERIGYRSFFLSSDLLLKTGLQVRIPKVGFNVNAYVIRDLNMDTTIIVPSLNFKRMNPHLATIKTFGGGTEINSDRALSVNAHLAEPINVELNSVVVNDVDTTISSVLVNIDEYNLDLKESWPDFIVDFETTYLNLYVFDLKLIERLPSETVKSNFGYIDFSEIETNAIKIPSVSMAVEFSSIMTFNDLSGLTFNDLSGLTFSDLTYN